MTDNISEKDKKDWENFLSKNEKLPNKDIKIDKKKTFKTRSIDLHGYTLEEANKSIENFIIKSYQEKINKLIVVTGKGIHSHLDFDLIKNIRQFVKTRMKKILMFQKI